LAPVVLVFLLPELIFTNTVNYTIINKFVICYFHKGAMVMKSVK